MPSPGNLVLLRRLFSSSVLTKPTPNFRAFTKEQQSILKKISRPDPSSRTNLLAAAAAATANDALEKHAPTTDKLLSPMKDAPNIKSPTHLSSNLIKSQDLNKIYNQENPTLPKLSVKCAGCGADLHCNSAGLPGFIPVNEYETIVSSQLGRQKARMQRYMRIPVHKICVRCKLLKDHQIAATATFEPSCYDDQIASVIRNKENTSILVIADMTNLPHSLIPDLHSKLMGSRYVLIGNKVDQLPIDGSNFLDRWKHALVEDFKSRCNVPNQLISHVCFISALTGYGVSDLVDFLLSRRFQFKSPVYLVGSTNVGKSSLFNRLILSDYCKAEARETIHRATISVWPGTTTGLLNFPITLLTNPVKYAKRTESLHAQKQKNKSKESIEITQSYGFKYLRPQDVLIGLHDTQSPFSRAMEKTRNTLPDLTKLPTYSWQSQKEPNSDSRPNSSYLASEYDAQQLRQDYLPGETYVDESTWEGDMGKRLLSNLLDPRHFNDKAWCHDTPGFICQDQSLNYLPQKDLLWLEQFKSHGSGQPIRTHGGRIKLGKVIVPRTFVMRPGLSLLLGRLARLDVIEASRPVYLTTFSQLPIHIVNQSEVDDYLVRYASFLGPGFDPSPTGQNQPGLAGSLLPLKPVVLDPLEISTDRDTSFADVILSGAGWVSVTCSRPPKSTEEQPSKDPSEELPDEEFEPSTSNSDNAKYSILLHAWTPGGLGIYVRKPSLIAGAVKRRGFRIPRLREYSGLH